MPIKQKFIISYLPGSTGISFGEWLATQSKDEQSRYHQARARMDAYRQEAIDAGLMSIEIGTGAYIWRDEQAKQQGKRQDDECMDFYTRYNSDAGIRVDGVFTEI